MSPSDGTDPLTPTPPTERAFTFAALEAASKATGTLDADVSNTQSLIDQEVADNKRVTRAYQALKARRMILKLAGLTVVVVIGLAVIFLTGHSAGKKALNSSRTDASQKYSAMSIPLANLSSGAALSTAGQTLSVNGQLNVNNSLVLSPTTQPSGGVTGQLYYNQASNQLAYYNGKQFVNVLSGDLPASTTVNGTSGALTTGSGLSVNGKQLANSGVLTLQGESGNVNLTGGPGIVVNGTSLSNSGLLSLGGQNGAITLGTGLTLNGNTLNATTSNINSLSGSGNISVTNDGNGNLTISTSGQPGLGTVTSGGGTSGKLAMFDGVQDIADSLVSQSGGVVTVTGGLTVTGSLTLSTPLSVAQGGTGATTAANARTALGAAAKGANSDITSLTGLTSALSVTQGGTGVGTLATNGILVGNGTSALSSIVASGANQCLVSTAGMPTFQACPGTTGVSSVNGGNGALTLSNSSLSGSTITINDASTSTKGIASFNSANFTVTSGVVNTIQNISTTSSVTFGSVAATTLSGNGASVTNVNAASLQGNTASFFTNASNISSGTLADGRLSANAALYGNTTSNFTGTLEQSGNAVCTIAGNCVGSGSGGAVGGSGTANTLAVFSGAGFTIANSIVSQNAGATTVTIAGNETVTGSVTAASFSGNGASITNVNAATLQGQAGSYYTNATNISTGTVSDGRLSTNVALLNANDNFTGTLQHNGNTVCDTSGNCVGSGGGVTTSGGTANTLAIFSGTSTIANSIIAQNAGATTVTITGGLSVTGGISATSLSGNGASVTNVNASQLNSQSASYYTNGSNINSGTVGDSFLSSNAALYNRATSNFTGALQQAGNAVCTTAGNCVGSGAGGALGGSGTVNTIAMFTGSGFTVANSLLSQDAGATSVTVTGNESVTGTLTSSGLLNASNGFNVTAGTITLSNLTGGTSTCLTLDGSNHVGVATCASGSGSSPTLQNVYDNSGSAPTIALASKGVTIQDSASPISGNLFAIKNSAGTSTYFAVTTTGVTINGTVTATSFSGDGSAITNVNAATLQGQAGSYYTNASNISSGTLADGRLSTNVALLNANDNFTGTLQHNGNNVCDVSGNCVGVSGGALGGSGTANTIAMFNNAGFTVGNSLLSQDAGATTVTIGGTLSVNGNITSTGSVSATSLSGNGSGVTNVNASQLNSQSASYYTNASNINSGTLNDSRLSTNVALYGSTTSNFTGSLQQGGNNVCTTAGNCVATGGAGSGVGGGGTANKIALFTGSGFTVSDSILSQNAGATTVTVTGALTATGTITANAFSGNGAAVTNVNAASLQGNTASYYTNASNISSGTLADGRLSANAALYNNTTSNFTGVLQQNGNTVCDNSNNCNYLTGSAASGTYIELQAGTPGTAQTGNLNITGAGIAGSLQASSLDTTGSSTLSIGTTHATAISIGQSGVGTTVNGQLNATQSVVISGTFTTSNNVREFITGTLNSSTITSQYALQNAMSFNPTGASLNSVYGSANNPTISGSALNISNYVGVASALATGSGYTGTIGTAVDFQAADPTISGSHLFNTYYEFSGGAISANSGNTSGTINNYGLSLAGATAAAASGGTLNNYGIKIVQPSGSGAGTTNNYGLYIQGNGGGSINYSVYNASTALSYFVGNIQSAATIIANAFTQNGNSVCDTSNNCNYLTGSAASGTYVQLQSSTPGTAQTGSFNVSGNGIIGGTLTVPTVQSSGNLTLQAGSGISAATIDSADSSGAVYIAPTNAGVISIGSGAAASQTIYIGFTSGSRSIFIGSTAGTGTTSIASGSNILFQTNNSSSSVTVSTSTNSATAFQIQNASSVTIFNANTTNGNITLGSAASGNYITFSAGGGLVASGTAQHTKSISLNAEYAGAVLDAQGDSTCTTATNGSMTSGYDYTNDMGYYQWASNAPAQCYDVVVRMTLPTDFNGWSSSTPLSLSTYSNDLPTGLLNVDLRDTTHTEVAGCAYASATPSSSSTWANGGGACSFSGGTFSAGGTITLRIRMTGSSADQVRIGDLSLNYKSKF